MSKVKLCPQVNLDREYNYWESLNKRLSYLLDVHEEQGNKTKIFPLDLAYMITNKWNKNEQNSYKIYCSEIDFNEDKLKMKAIDSIEGERKRIHEKLRYLLNLHKNNDINSPFPLDLVYLLNLDTSYYFDALKCDKSYNYERDYSDNFYNSTDFYLTWKGEDKSFNQFRFFDLESETNINYLKAYLKCEYKTDSVPEDYLLWKSAKNDNIYNYNRSHFENFYNPDNYLPEEEEEDIDEYEYYGLVDEYEPYYKGFNHFIDLKFVDQDFDCW